MNNSPPRISILIVNWNGRCHLVECLDSLAAQTFQSFEVVLVDNVSVEFLRRQYPWVRLLEF